MHIEYVIYSLKQNCAFDAVGIAMYLTKKHSGYGKKGCLCAFVTGAEQLIQWANNIFT